MYLCVCVCACLYVCMYVCMYVLAYACMYYKYVHTYVDKNTALFLALCLLGVRGQATATHWVSRG